MSVELRDSYQAIYQQAIQQMGAGESQEAIDSLRRIIQRLGRLRPETLRRKPGLQQTLVLSWNAVTQFLSWEQRHQEAIDLTQEILERLPDPITGSMRIASLTVESGQVEEGLAALTQIAEEQDDFAAWATLGAEFRALQRHDEAVSAYESALRRATSNEDAVMANVALFTVHRAAGRVTDALGAWKMALVLDPEMADQSHQVYGWLIRAGMLEEAAPYLEREAHPIRRTFFQGLVDWQENREQAARRKWQQTIDMDSEPEADVDVEATMEAALRLGDPEVAESVAQTLSLSGELISFRGEALRGMAELLLGKEEQAHSHFRQALLRYQRSSHSQSGLAADQWELLTHLITDPESTASVAHYFETGP
jgi:tetratricopeptide (TPR) repeat protein